jgi:hypothetical protein
LIATFEQDMTERPKSEIDPDKKPAESSSPEAPDPLVESLKAFMATGIFAEPAQPPKPAKGDAPGGEDPKPGSA